MDKIFQTIRRDWKALSVGLFCGLVSAATVQVFHADLFITKFGYALFPISGLVGALLIEYKLRNYSLTEDAYRVLSYLQHILGAVTLRIGWFSVSRAFPTDGFVVGNSPHNQWMWENKVYMAIVAGFWFATYVYKLMNEIAFMSKFETAGVIAMVVFGAMAMGWFG